MPSNQLRTIKHNKLATKIKRNAPKILRVVGIAGLVASPVLAVRSTVYAVRAVDRRKEELQIEKLPVGEIVKTTWKYYIPVVAVTGISAASTLKSDAMKSKETAMLATAYAAAERTLADTKAKIVEKLGEDKEREIAKEVTAEQVNREIEQDKLYIHSTGDGDVIFREPTLGIMFKSNRDAVNKAWAKLYAQVKNDDNADMNAFLYHLNLDEADAGLYFGWNAKMLKDLVYPSYIGIEDPRFPMGYWLIKYDFAPTTDFDDRKWD